jgi:hypothetical protein
LKVGHVVGCIMVCEIVVGLEGLAVVGCVVVGGTWVFSSCCRGPFGRRWCWLSTLQPPWVAWLVEVLHAGFVVGVVVDEDVGI